MPCRRPSVQRRPLRRLAFFGRVDEKKGLRAVRRRRSTRSSPSGYAGLELEFVGKTTATGRASVPKRLLSEQTRRALARLSFETGLDQHEALARLSRPARWP